MYIGSSLLEKLSTKVQEPGKHIDRLNSTKQMREKDLILLVDHPTDTTARRSSGAPKGAFRLESARRKQDLSHQELRGESSGEAFPAHFTMQEFTKVALSSSWSNLLLLTWKKPHTYEYDS